jgi:hypothetical protein
MTCRPLSFRKVAMFTKVCTEKYFAVGGSVSGTGRKKIDAPPKAPLQSPH